MTRIYVMARPWILHLYILRLFLCSSPFCNSSFIYRMIFNYFIIIVLYFKRLSLILFSLANNSYY
jgi:hypothetical protein